MELAIFDLDGTLIDSMAIWKGMGKSYLKDKFNIASTDGLEKVLNTLSFTKSAEYLVSEYNLNIDVSEVLDDWYSVVKKAYSETIVKKSGVLEYLQYLKDKGVSMCIATACDKKLAEEVTIRLGIRDFVDFIITVDEVGKPKTEPDLFLYCSNKYQIPVDKCTVFEDSLYAIQAAKNAGFEVIAVKDLNYDKDKGAIDKISDMQIDTYLELIK